MIHIQYFTVFSSELSGTLQVGNESAAMTLYHNLNGNKYIDRTTVSAESNDAMVRWMRSMVSNHGPDLLPTDEKDSVPGVTVITVPVTVSEEV